MHGSAAAVCFFPPRPRGAREKEKPPAAELRLPALKELLFARGERELMTLFLGAEDTEGFVTWRNRRFGHGVFGHDVGG
jgi:hypothetical protein